jgi:hypothetical protein
MNSRRLWIITVAVALATGLLAATPATEAASGPGGGGVAGEARVEGTITAITLNSVTITTVRGVPVSVAVVPATKIERNGVRTTLAGLRLGDRGQARYFLATGVAFKVESVGP